MPYSFTDVILSSFYNLLHTLVAFLPQILGALVVFVFGLFVSEGAGRLVARALKEIYLDVAVDKTGSKKILEKIGLKYSLSKVLGLLVTWFLYLVFLIAIADILHLPQITEFLKNIVLYLPNVVVAIIILVIGMLISDLVRGIVDRSAAASKVPHVHYISSLARWSILLFSIMAALVHLKVASNLIMILFAGLVFMIALAGGLAFGLGGRDKASEILRSLGKNTKGNGSNGKNIK